MTASYSRPDGADDVEVFRSRFNLAGAIILWALCGVASVAVALGTAGGAAAGYLAPIVLVAFGTWMVLWRPAVRVSDDAVRLVNVTRTIEIPWPALIQVDTRFALTLRTPHGRFTASAAPAPGRLNISRGRSDTIPGRSAFDGPARTGDLPSTDSGAAAWLVRDRWNRLAEAGRIELGVADTTPVVSTWHWTTLAICAGLLVGSLFALGTV